MSLCPSLTCIADFFALCQHIMMNPKRKRRLGHEHVQDNTALRSVTVTGAQTFCSHADATKNANSFFFRT